MCTAASEKVIYESTKEGTKHIAVFVQQASFNLEIFDIDSPCLQPFLSAAMEKGQLLHVL